ncbi:MAG TPA: fructosamine kinase family protein [Gammaproteobacteria bacterium]|nr:fructosamine kinase family protein [Gammaproteobacteria bacterium]
MPEWTDIARQLSEATRTAFTPREQRPVSGGCINRAYVIGDGRRRYFVKLNDAAAVDMFAAEAEGLEAIIQSGTVRVPRPWCWGVSGREAFIALDYLDFTGRSGGDAELGERLAAMHRHTRTRYGWHRDNTIGATPQINTEEDDWVTFWSRHRLKWQLDLAAGKGYGGNLQRLGERCLAALPAWFRGYSPPASLLHGDLWSGNYAFTAAGPAVFDPAVYYGDRETDLAMTELFGGFAPDFYAAYRAAYPLDAGYSVRKTLYNLYHVLNHLNLFGGGYRSQAENMLARLLSEMT